jgi:hypothetical protein
MHNSIRIRFGDDGDGTGRLSLRAEVDGFSGESSAYFNIETLEAFAKALQEFPLPVQDERRSIVGGFGSPREQVHLATCLSGRCKTRLRRNTGDNGNSGLAADEAGVTEAMYGRISDHIRTAGQIQRRI